MDLSRHNRQVCDLRSTVDPSGCFTFTVDFSSQGRFSRQAGQQASGQRALKGGPLPEDAEAEG
jgi:hypothetical protein